MPNRFDLGTKLILAFLLVGVIPFGVIGVVSLLKTSGALSNQAFAQLEAVREIKKAQVEGIFEAIHPGPGKRWREKRRGALWPL